MKRVTVQAVLPCDREKVWEILTDNAHTAWRSDLSKVDRSPDGLKFVEYTKKGFPTFFTITVKRPPVRYEFDIQNRNLRGHWTGTLEQTARGTLLSMTEEVSVKNPVMNLFVTVYLKKQQAQYLADLQRALGV